MNPFIKTKKVAFVVNNSAFFVSHRLIIAERILKDGGEVKIFFGQGGNKIMEEEAMRILHNKKIIFKKLMFSNSIKNIFLEIYGFFQLLSELRKFRPSFVHSISPKGNLLGIMSCFLLSSRSIVIAFSGMGTLFTGNRSLSKKIVGSIYFFVFKSILRFIRYKIIVQNNDDKDFLKNNLKINSSNIFLIKGSGVHLNKYSSNIDKKKNMIILPARMIREKGIIEFVDASRYLKAKFNDWRFVLIGAADYDNPSAIKKEEIINWVQEGFIEWTGYLNNLESYYKDSLIVCLPSYREGMPKCLLEAAAASCAVVTTDVIGCRDSIIPKVTGELVKAMNTHDLKKVLEKLINDTGTIKKYGLNGLTLAKKQYNIDNIVIQTFEVYKSIIKS